MIVLYMIIATSFPSCTLSAELRLPQQEEAQTWLWWPWEDSLNPVVAAETGLLDRLGQYYGCCCPDYMSSTTVVFGLQNNKVPLFHKEVFQDPAPSYCWLVINDANYLSVCILEKVLNKTDYF